MTQTLSYLERILLRLLLNGCTLDEAAQALGVSQPELESVLVGLQRRCDAPCLPRLLTIAILNAWV